MKSGRLFKAATQPLTPAVGNRAYFANINHDLNRLDQTDPATILFGIVRYTHFCILKYNVHV